MGPINLTVLLLFNRSLVNKDLSEDIKNIVITAAKSDLNENIQVIVGLHYLLRMKYTPRKAEKFVQVNNNMEDASTNFQVVVEQYG